MTEQEIQKVIGKLSWKFAKSMANIPHFYTVRDRQNKSRELLYISLYEYIKENGVIEYFFRKPYKYAYIGDYKYWYMSDDIETSDVINRAEWRK